MKTFVTSAPLFRRFCNAQVDKQSHVLQGSFQSGRISCISGFRVEDIRRAAQWQQQTTDTSRINRFRKGTIFSCFNIYSTRCHRTRMPFLGQDWRSPGQSWVKTEVGWKKTTADDKNNNVSVERLVIKQVLRNVAAFITVFDMRNS